MSENRIVCYYRVGNQRKCQLLQQYDSSIESDSQEFEYWERQQQKSFSTRVLEFIGVHHE